jgi:light-regulated signal transduction histidine kinase (bacteriophytochrome)
MRVLHCACSRTEGARPVRLMPETTIDLSECDREPIHVPGSIQPHGVLLVAENGHRARAMKAPDR